MRKLFSYLLLVFALGVSSCNYDDAPLWDKINDHEDRISRLEEMCREMNSNIAALQTLVDAMNEGDYIKSILPIVKDGSTIGYTITFAKNDPITIYHGDNGKDGANGKDGYTPQIGVEKDADGIHYWTLDGEWLTDEAGNKIKAIGIDGEDGTNGTDGKDGADGANGEDGTNGIDGITPQLKIENGYWYVSYNNGATWVQLGKATGEDGADGEDGANGADGDSFFQGVDTSNQDYIVFTLSDGTEIKIPTWYSFEKLQAECNKMNKNIEALQTIVEALQNNDYVESITPIMENGVEVGYTIKFTKSGVVTIYHGEDGTNGADGANGKDGADGYTPVIGVKQDTDGIYYWMLDGEWLTDEAGNKIKAVGTDGKDGADGENGKDGANGENGQNGANGENGKDGVDGVDGITPQLKIEEDYWYVSYDEGSTWTKLGKATGENGADGKDGANGADGEDGDSFFSSVTVDDKGVHFVLADGTEFIVPLAPDSLLAELDDISFIPKYTDGKATVTRYADGVTLAEFDFSVAPKSIVTTIAENYESLLSINAVETATRAVTLIRMPIVSCKADANSGTISIQASGEFLNPGAFDGSVTYSAALTISDGANSVISDYIELCTFVSTENSPEEEPETPADPEAPEEPELPSDEKIIYYTTTDNAPVELGATTGFGGILLSNEYDEEANLGRLIFSAKVTCIPANAFKSSTISTISFPNTVTEIGDDAFYQSKISEITIPNTITKLGKEVFYDCNSLRTANINCACDITWATGHRYGIFEGSGLWNVAIGDCVTGIGGDAFKDCTVLSTVEIGNSVSNISDNAFYNCKSLKSINIPDSVIWIGTSVFEGCTSLVTADIGNGVKDIYSRAFYNCESLTSVIFGNGLQTVGEDAFYECPKIQSLYINDLANFCAIDFHVSNYVITYTPNIANPLYKRECKLYLNGNLVENLIIPDGVTKIGAGTFCNCDHIKSITIPDSVTTISSYAFYNCDEITTVEIPGSDKPDYTTTIGKSAFSLCGKLASVTVGERVSSIKDYAFYCCNNLQKFYCKATTIPSLGADVFYGSNGYKIGTEIYVPTEKVDEYKAATNWRAYADYIYGYDF